jgi:Fe-S oxidoreductase
MVNFEVVFITQYIAELLAAGRLKLKGEFARKVTYHDPCYLGRHNQIYDEPRAVLQQVAGLELSEMADSREKSLCCGGGGSRIWMETPQEERFSGIRVRQALAVGAEVLVTSCPYCITNFTDSCLGLGEGEKLEIMDITEIIQHVI